METIKTENIYIYISIINVDSIWKNFIEKLIIIPINYQNFQNRITFDY